MVDCLVQVKRKSSRCVTFRTVRAGTMTSTKSSVHHTMPSRSGGGTSNGNHTRRCTVVSLSVCLSACPSICLSVCLSVCHIHQIQCASYNAKPFRGWYLKWKPHKKMYSGRVSLLIRPSSDGTYYGMVMSVRVSVRPSIRPSVRLSVRPFSALFSYMFWYIELKFCTWLCFDVLQIKFNCRHFASNFEGVMLLCELRIKIMCSFPHFSPTCFDILSWNFAYGFVSPYYRSSSNAVNLR